jgi:hypothetical protein
MKNLVYKKKQKKKQKKGKKSRTVVKSLSTYNDFPEHFKNVSKTF